MLDSNLVDLSDWDGDQRSDNNTSHVSREIFDPPAEESSDGHETCKIHNEALY